MYVYVCVSLLVTGSNSPRVPRWSSDLDSLCRCLPHPPGMWSLLLRSHSILHQCHQRRLPGGRGLQTTVMGKLDAEESVYI